MMKTIREVPFLSPTYVKSLLLKCINLVCWSKGSIVDGPSKLFSSNLALFYCDVGNLITRDFLKCQLRKVLGFVNDVINDVKLASMIQKFSIHYLIMCDSYFVSWAHIVLFGRISATASEFLRQRDKESMSSYRETRTAHVFNIRNTLDIIARQEQDIKTDLTGKECHGVSVNHETLDASSSIFDELIETIVNADDQSGVGDGASLSILNIVAYWIFVLTSSILIILSEFDLLTEPTKTLGCKFYRHYVILLHFQLQILFKTIKISSISSDTIAVYVENIVKIVEKVERKNKFRDNDCSEALTQIQELSVQLVVSFFRKSMMIQNKNSEFNLSKYNEHPTSSRQVSDIGDKAISFDDNAPQVNRGQIFRSKGSKSFAFIDPSYLSPTFYLCRLYHMSQISNTGGSVFLKIITRELGSGNDLSLSPSFQLVIANAIVDFAAAEISFKLAVDSDWNNHMGMIGFCEIIRFFRRLVVSAPFKISAIKMNIVAAIANTIFGQVTDDLKINDDIIHYLRIFWKCRVLQLECVSDMISHSNFHDYKDFVRQLIEIHAKDVDIRVRFCLINKLPVLLSLFQNKEKAYAKLYQLLNASNALSCQALTTSPRLCLEDFGEDLLFCVGSCAMLAMIGMESPTTYYKSISDILKINSTMSKMLAPSAVANLSNYVSNNGCLDSFICNLFQVIITRLKYSCYEAFMDENSSWLIAWWIGYCNTISIADIVNFPIQLFAAVATESFVNLYIRKFISGVILLVPVKQQMEAITTCCRIVGVSDSATAERVVKNNKLYLIAMSFLQKYRLIVLGKSDQHVYYSISTFFSAISGSELKLSSFSELSSVVFTICEELTSIRVDDNFVCIRENIDSIEASLIMVLTDIAKQLNIADLNSLFESCNVVELCSLLYRRSVSFKSQGSKDAILAVVNIILKYYINESMVWLLAGLSQTAFRCVDYCWRSVTTVHTLRSLSSANLNSKSPYLQKQFMYEIFASHIIITEMYAKGNSLVNANSWFTDIFSCCNCKLINADIPDKNFDEWLEFLKFYFESLIHQTCQSLPPIPRIIYDYLWKYGYDYLYGNVPDYSAEIVILSIIGTMKQVLAGVDVSLTTLCFEVQYLIELKDSVNQSFPSWDLFPQLIKEFVFLLLQTSSSIALPSKLKSNILFFIGYFGSPNCYSLSHADLFVGYNYPKSIFSIVKQASMMLCGKIWNENILVGDVCMKSLRNLAEYRVFKRINVEDCENEFGIDDDSFRFITDCFAKEITTRNSDVTNSPNTLNFDSAFNIVDKKYDDWVTETTTVMIDALLHNNQNRMSTTDDSASDVEEIISYLLPFREAVSSLPSLGNILFSLSLLGITYLLDKQSDTIIKISHQFRSILRLLVKSKETPMSVLSQTAARKAARMILQSVLFCMHQHFHKYRDNFSSLSQDVSTPKALSKSKSRRKTGWKCPFQPILNISYTELAEASLEVEWNCYSILMTELSAEETFCSPKLEDDLRFRAFRASMKLHEPDSFRAFIPNNDIDTQALLFERDRKWLNMLSSYDSMLCYGSKINHRNIHMGIQRALEGMGNFSVKSHYSDVSNVRSLDLSSETLDKLDFAHQSLSTWQLDSSDVNLSNTAESHLEALCCLARSREYQRLDLRLTEICSNIIQQLSFHMDDEHAFSMGQGFKNLQTLIEIREVADINCLNESLDISSTLLKLFKTWNNRLTCHSDQFHEQMKMMKCQTDIITTLNLEHLQSDSIFQFVDSFVDIASNHENLFTSFSSSFYNMKLLFTGQSSSSNPSGRAPFLSSSEFRWLLYETKIMWQNDIKDQAIRHLNSNIISVIKESHSERQDFGNIYAEALRLGGEYLQYNRSATADIILTEYLSPSYQEAVSIEQRLRSSSSLAKFHIRLHDNVHARINSPEWKQIHQRIADRRHQISMLDDEIKQFESRYQARKLTPSESADRSLKLKLKNDLVKESEYDRGEIKAAEESAETYLLEAIKYLGLVLRYSDEANYDEMSQIVSLWFNNPGNTAVNKLIGDIILQIPSYKFIPLSYQLFSRIGALVPSSVELNSHVASNSMTSESHTSFTSALHTLIYTVCRDHPHHTLPQLFALVNELDFGSLSGSEQYKSNISSKGRSEIANSIVSELKKDSSIESLIISYQSLLTSYIDLATASVGARSKGIPFSDIILPRFPRNSFHQVVNSFPKKPSILTISHALNKDKDYSKIIKIEQFESTFSIAETGISRPKFVKVRGSDGKTYTQIVKSGDDMRQDAVMQQVFEYLNAKLSSDAKTKNRRLWLRTYKVIPTSPQTGICQFVDDTKAFGHFLALSDNGGAHGRYFPNDWSHMKCREYFQNIVRQSDRLLVAYHEICKNFNPVFRWFFIENFCSPVAWMASRLAYTKSVAATSMVGHILGIGDRHLQNILMDTITGEVVHIDFGLVFEQAKNLPVPELVPFRLTRDVVDGFGISGCEGTFRKSCEQVLRVLRENSSQLMTILDVIVHDPLYRWSVSPNQARNKQNSSRSNVTKTDKDNNSVGRDAAERTLRRIKLKLQGNEDPAGEPLSVEGQVGYLINESSNPANLCLMYYGWSPWV